MLGPGGICIAGDPAIHPQFFTLDFTSTADVYATLKKKIQGLRMQGTAGVRLVRFNRQRKKTK